VNHRRFLSLASVGAVIAGVGVSMLSTPVQAATDVYTPPSVIAGAPGTVLKSSDSIYPAGPLKINTYNADVKTVLYVSTGANGEKTAVSGTVIVPKTAWTGPGERPIVSYAAGTQGMADQCAPSKQLAAGTLYDGAFIKGFFDKGYAIAMTDYQGLGTPGEHPYALNSVLGKNTLDVVRAAQQLGYSKTAPVYIAGFSEGGGASADALEEHGSYAPELKVKAGYVGAPTSDLGAIAQKIENTTYQTFLLFAVKMLYDTYPDVHQAIDDLTNAQGKNVLTDAYVDNLGCLPNNLVPTWFVNTTSLTKDGSTISSHLGEEPYKSRLAALLQGNAKIDVPTVVNSSWGDDVIPHDSVTATAKRWCAKRSNIRYQTAVAPTHVASGYEMGFQMAGFFSDRTSNSLFLSNCAWF
jgi:alpha-beta hydrolase superfamily lysophospholipase